MTCQQCNCCRYFLSLPILPKENELKRQNFSCFQSFGSAFFSGPISEWCWPPSDPLEAKIWIKAAKDTEIFPVVFLCTWNCRYYFAVWGPRVHKSLQVLFAGWTFCLRPFLSKHADTSSSGKPLHQPLQTAQCQLTDICVLAQFPAQSHIMQYFHVPLVPITKPLKR